MKNLNFSWDDKKNLANQKKHHVSFEEAQTVFFDEHAIEFDDPDHSENENRFLLLGLSHKNAGFWLFATAFKVSESEIRIISARKATKKEQTVYFKV